MLINYCNYNDRWNVGNEHSCMPPEFFCQIEIPTINLDDTLSFNFFSLNSHLNTMNTLTNKKLNCVQNINAYLSILHARPQLANI